MQSDSVKEFAKTRLYGAFFVLFTTLICAIALSHAVQSHYTSADQYWHLQTGQDLITRNWNPNRDNYSFTYSGEKISQQPILFQATFGLLGKYFGLDGAVVLVRAISALLFFAALGLMMRAIKAPSAAIAIALCSSTFLISQRLLARPELFDHILIPMGFYLYWRTLSEWSTRNLAFTLCFLLAWVNFHAAILAYVIFAGMFIDAITSKQNPEHAPKLIPWMLWGFLFLLVGFLNTSYQHPVIEAAQFSDAWNAIGEHQPSTDLLVSKPYLYTLWLVGSILIIWSIVIQRFGLALTLAVFLWASIDRSRMITLSGLAFTSGFLLLVASEKSKAYFQTLKPELHRLIAVFAVGFCALTVSTFNFSPQSIKEQQHPPIDDSISHLVRFSEGGTIYNNYNWGGYLIYRTSPKFKVFIDGRTNILYPLEHFEDYIAVSRGDTNVAAEISQKFEPEYLLWDLSRTFHPLTAVTFNRRAQYIGDQSIIYSSRGSLQPVADILVFPMCIDYVDSDRLGPLAALVATQFPPNESLTRAVEIVTSNHEAQDLHRLVEELLSLQPSEHELATVGHWALSRNHFSEALKIWNAKKPQSTLDMLVASYAALMAEDLDWARTHLTLLLFDAISFKPILPSTQIEQTIFLFEELTELGGSNDGLKDLMADFHKKFVSAESRATQITRNNFIVSEFCSDLNLNY